MVPPALSPSRAADFRQCPLRYRFRVLDRLPEPVFPAAERGTLVHAVLERVFDLPASRRTPEVASGLVAGEWARIRAERPEVDQLFGGDPDAEQGWLAGARALVRRWFTLEDPAALEPLEREAHVEAALAPGVHVHGYVDRLDAVSGGQLRIVDYKTGRSPGPAFEAAAWFQLKFYALAIWRQREQVPVELMLVHLGDGQVLRRAVTAGELEGFARVVRALWTAIAEAYETATWSPSPGRGCDWCAHRALCPAWGGSPPPLPSPPWGFASDARALPSLVTAPPAAPHPSDRSGVDDGCPAAGPSPLLQVAAWQDSG